MSSFGIVFALCLACSLCSAFLQSSSGLLYAPRVLNAPRFTAGATRFSKEVFKADEKQRNKKEPELTGFDRLKKALSEANDPKNKRGPPIYTPGPYQFHFLSAAAYLIPIADASDVGKYMFQAYPEIGRVYETVFGPIAGIYNGVPFLPFAIFFLMSYVARAPTFPVEVRFHFAQAFMLSIIQFIPSLALGLFEKLGIPGLGIAYNTVFIWVMTSALLMQALLLNPFAATKNPFLVNVVGWAMRYMNYNEVDTTTWQRRTFPICKPHQSTERPTTATYSINYFATAQFDTAPPPPQMHMLQ